MKYEIEQIVQDFWGQENTEMKKRPVIESPGDLEIVDQEQDGDWKQDGALGGNPYILKPNFGGYFFGPKASITKAMGYFLVRA